jgi:hypothetical protein
VLPYVLRCEGTPLHACDTLSNIEGVLWPTHLMRCVSSGNGWEDGASLCPYWRGQRLPACREAALGVTYGCCSGSRTSWDEVTEPHLSRVSNLVQPNYLLMDGEIVLSCVLVSEGQTVLLQQCWEAALRRR